MSAKKICRIAIVAAMMFVFKQALAFIPNVEVVTCIVCVGTIVFGWEMLLTTVVFSLLQIMIYGVGLWTLQYLYIWNILVLVVMLLKGVIKRKTTWCIVMALYGALFGAFCAIPYLVGGLSMAVTWWVSGIPYDVVHAVGNFVIGLIAFNPLLRVMRSSERFV